NSGTEPEPVRAPSPIYLKAPERADAEHVDVGLLADAGAERRLAAAHLVIALPFAPHGEVRRDVVTQPEPEGEIIVVVLESAENAVHVLNRRPVDAQPAADVEPIDERCSRDDGRFPRGNRKGSGE